eukprot:1047054-Pelagomonas_calceolata.AAC.3
MHSRLEAGGSSGSNSDSGQSEVEESWEGDAEVARGMRPGQEARAALRALRIFHERTVRRRFPLSNCEWSLGRSCVFDVRCFLPGSCGCLELCSSMRA